MGKHSKRAGRQWLRRRIERRERANSPWFRKRLRAGNITADELERIRKPLLDDTAHRRETAGWWLNTLDGSFADPYKLAQARTWQADYSSIPVAEVNTVARRWLAREPMVAAALPEGPVSPLNPSGN